MITILGASGFIGSQIVRDLKTKGIDYYAPSRNERLVNRDLGEVIYCIGLTADFRQKPHETISAHISYLSEFIQNNTFNSLSYLSSARVYIHNTTSDEKSKIYIDPNDPFDFYNSSKLTGELLALNSGRKNVKIVRLSNVYGDDYYSDNFITSITRDALINKKIVLRTSLDSSKDYISVLDVSEMLIRLAQLDITGIFNCSRGFNVTNGEILTKMKSLTNCAIDLDKDAEVIVFPTIVNKRLIEETSYEPKYNMLDDLEGFVSNFKIHLNSI